MDDESISKICTSAFSEGDILTAKNLLFDSLPKKRRKITRKKEGKSIRDIDDIICLLRVTDSEDIPVFVARDLEKLPPVLFDHIDVTRLLKDIVKLQEELKGIKKGYASIEGFKELKYEIEMLKETVSVNNYPVNVNKRRGACIIDSFECNSGPKGLPPMINDKDKNDHQNICLRKSEDQNNKTTTFSNEGIYCSPHTNASKRHESEVTAVMTHPAATANRSDKSARHTANSVDNNIMMSKTKTVAEIFREGEWKNQKKDDEWIQVQRKRTRNRFMGHRGKAILEPGNKFKAAETKIPIYIYNVSKEVSVCDIHAYIKTKLSLDVDIEKNSMKIKKDYESYKIFVPKHKLDLFMSDEFWPEGVAYRRFFDFKQRVNGNAYKNSVNNQNLI